MSYNVNELRSGFTGSGARPNLFEIQFTFPPSAPDGNASRLVTQVTFAASAPESNLGLIQLSYYGRKLKYPGDRTYSAWETKFYNDENHTIKNALEKWSQSLNSAEGNLRSAAAATPFGYQVDITVRELSKIGGPALKEYKLVGAYPESVQAVNLNWGDNNTIQEITVVWQYQWWTSDTTD